MPNSPTISKTDLARKTRQVLSRAQKDSPIIVESYGEEEAAILDIWDYRLLQAVAFWSVQSPGRQGGLEGEPQGLEESAVGQAREEAGGDPQAAWNLVMGAYLHHEISLGRAARLLGLSRFELAGRFHRLNLPLPLEPQSKVEVLDDLQTFQK